jgi:phosphate transport system substrate-binding protein
MRTNLNWGLLCLAILTTPSLGLAIEPPVDDQLDRYKPSGVALEGSVGVGAAPQLRPFPSLWTEDLHAHFPSLTINTEFKGHARSIQRLFEGHLQVVLTMRALTEEEIRSARKPPVSVVVGYVPAVLCVNKENPLVRRGITLAELDALISKTRRRGFAREVKAWGDLGLETEMAKVAVKILGPDALSPSLTVLEATVLEGGEFKEEMVRPVRFPAKQVAEDRSALTCASGLAFDTGARPVPIREGNAEGKLILPTADNIVTGRYPLRLPIAMVVMPNDAGAIPPAALEIMRLALSREGQAALHKSGFVPLSPKVAAAEKKLSANLEQKN